MEAKRQKMKRKSFLYQNQNHAVNLNNMRLNNKWCDITIRVNGIEIRAHKVILAANLKYFDTMLSNDSFKESKQDVIPMEDVQASDLEAFVSYAYTGEMLLSDINALGLLELANYLGEDGIKNACIEFLKENLRKEEACRAYKFASTLDCQSLKNAAKMTILSNFTDCSQTTEYLNFEFKQLVDILSAGKIESVSSQQKYFEGIMRWIMFDVATRKIHMEDLLNSIDIAKLTADYLLNHLYSNNVIDRNDELGIMKDVMFCYHSNKSKHGENQTLMIVGFGTNGNLTLQFCNLAEKKWSPLEEIPCSHSPMYSRGVVLNDEFYYYGSNSEGVRLNVLNLTTKRNLTFPSLLSSSILSSSSLCACGKFLYFCGGRINSQLKSNQVLRLDPQTNSIETLPPMATERSSAAAVFYQDCLYVLGGTDGSNVLSSIEKYDPDTNEWMAFPSMTESRNFPAVAVLDGKLYACRGVSKKSVEMYDPAKDSWQPVASMNKQRCPFIVVVYEGKLLAIGGDRDNEETVEVYDPSRDEWQIDQELSSGLQIEYPYGGFITFGCIPHMQ